MPMTMEAPSRKAYSRALSDRNRRLPIAVDDLRQLLSSAVCPILPEGDEAVACRPVEWRVNGEVFINPVGLFGDRLEVTVELTIAKAEE
ncbi:MAG: hypothetical protein ABIZ80_20905 [Bryobacteraceae bacterium]